MSADILTALVNGGGFAVLIWLTYSLREEQRAVNSWMMTVIQDAMLRDLTHPGTILPPHPNSTTPPSGGSN